MTKQIYSIITIALLATILSGCVIKDTFQEIEATTNEAIITPFENCCVYRRHISQGDQRLLQNHQQLKIGMSLSEVEQLVGRPQNQAILNQNRHEHIYQQREEGFGKTLFTIYLELTYDNNNKLSKIEVINNTFATPDAAPPAN